MFLKELLELFQNNITSIRGTQGGTSKLITKIKENWFYCGFGQWILVWQRKWYSEIVIFWKKSTQAITITTRFCPQNNIYYMNCIQSCLVFFFFFFLILSGSNFLGTVTQNPHTIRLKDFGIFLLSFWR